jgi:hypothetical protein
MRGNPGLTMAASFENLGRNNGSVGQSPCSEFGQSSSLGPYRSPEVKQVLVVHPTIRAVGDLAALRHAELRG